MILGQTVFELQEPLTLWWTTKNDDNNRRSYGNRRKRPPFWRFAKNNQIRGYIEVWPCKAPRQSSLIFFGSFFSGNVEWSMSTTDFRCFCFLCDDWSTFSALPKLAATFNWKQNEYEELSRTPHTLRSILGWRTATVATCQQSTSILVGETLPRRLCIAPNRRTSPTMMTSSTCQLIDELAALCCCRLCSSSLLPSCSRTIEPTAI